jgi:hypothetical protein
MLVRKAEWAAAGCLSLLAIAAHTMRLLHGGGLWRDEAAAVCLATLPSLRAVARLFPHEAFPLLVPMTLRLYSWIVGGGDLALRALGLGVGLAIVAALWLNARIAGRTLPLLSLALLATNADVLIYGDSLRGYGLGTLFILLAFGALANLLSRPGPWAATAALLAVLAAVHCLLANAALAGALCAAAAAVAWWRQRGDRRGRRLAFVVLNIGLAAALSLLPYASELAAARQWNVVVTYPRNLKQILQIFATTSGPGLARWIWLGLILAALGAAAWRAGAARRAAGRAWRPAGGAHDDRATGTGATGVTLGGAADLRLFCALVLVLAVAGEVVFLFVLGYRPRPWYYVPDLALVATALDPLVADLWRGVRARAWRVAASVGIAGLLLAPTLTRLDVRMTNVDLVARRLAAAAGTDDLVVVSPWYYGVSFNRYYHGAASWLTLPDLPEHQIHRYDLLKARMAAAQPLAGVEDEMRRTLLAGHRVWLVGDVRFPPPGQAAPVLPPAPAAPSGWHDYPYIQSWTLQLGELVRAHARSIEVVPVPAGEPVSPLETMSLVALRGWR